MTVYKVPEFYNTHPGEILQDELKVRNLSAAELARHMGLAPLRISQILRAKRAVTADTTLRLGIIFGTSPKFWLNLQQSYDLY